MVKGNDAMERKKKKARRKKMNKVSSTKVSDRIAEIIAAKKRRKCGKRRMCEGMCYSLPTPDDPFNDRLGKALSTKKESNKLNSSQDLKKGKTGSLWKENGDRNTALHNHKELKKEKYMTEPNDQEGLCKASKAKRLRVTEITDCPSKFLIMCLGYIQNGLLQDSSYSDVDNRPLFANTWGLEFWKCFFVGRDILETDGSNSMAEKIAWIVSTACDTLVKRENEGLTCDNPFLLFLVPSQEKAIKVRSICKPLSSIGFHAVSLHQGASLNHQIHGLKRSEPEFIVSTPERLLELIALKAVDVSGVSVLVLDGPDDDDDDSYVDMIISLRKSMPKDGPYTVIFNEHWGDSAIKMIRNVLHDRVCTVKGGQTACIEHSIHIFTSREEKLSRGIQLVKEESRFRRALVVSSGGEDAGFCERVADAVKGSVIMDVEEIGDAMETEEYEAVILPEFVGSVDTYVEIVNLMGGYSVEGVVVSFLTPEHREAARGLIEVLRGCGKVVPEELNRLCGEVA